MTAQYVAGVSHPATMLDGGIIPRHGRSSTAVAGSALETQIHLSSQGGDR